MRPQKQAFRHDPANGVYGDCYRTALACLLDLDRDEVPHFNDGPPDAERQDSGVDLFLEPLGLAIAEIGLAGPLENLLAALSTSMADRYYLLSGTSPRGTNHIVVCRGGEIVHDPAIDGGGLVGGLIREDTGEQTGTFCVSFLVDRKAHLA